MSEPQFFAPPGPPATEIILSDAEGNQTMITIQNGDIIATAIRGPNEGKFVNLTYGRWMSPLS